MKKEFPCLIMLSKPKHYHIALCSVTGQDWVPYINADIATWLDDNMTFEADYTYDTNIGPYKPEPETEKVGIAFATEEDAMAFKLRWI